MATAFRPVEGKYQPRPFQFNATRLEQTSDGGSLEMGHWRANAEGGSQKLRKRLLKYGAKHGLPNMTGLQCMSELRLLDRILDEDLALADRIEAELKMPSRLRPLAEDSWMESGSVLMT